MIDRRLSRLRRLTRTGTVRYYRFHGRPCVVVCCYWCATWMPWWAATLDHVVPRGVLNGANAPHNLVVACEACNAARNDALMRSEAGRLYNQVLALSDQLGQRIRALDGRLQEERSR